MNIVALLEWLLPLAGAIVGYLARHKNALNLHRNPAPANPFAPAETPAANPDPEVQPDQLLRPAHPRLARLLALVRSNLAPLVLNEVLHQKAPPQTSAAQSPGTDDLWGDLSHLLPTQPPKG